MFNRRVSTNEELHKCIEKQVDVVIWLFGACDGTAKITMFTEDSVKADNGYWYVRRHCTLYA